jgi:hypothetical protein
LKAIKTLAQRPVSCKQTRPASNSTRELTSLRGVLSAFTTTWMGEILGYGSGQIPMGYRYGSFSYWYKGRITGRYVNVYGGLNPQDWRVRFEGVGHLENLREMRRNQTRFGVLPPPPNERWTEVVLQDLRGAVLANLLSQTPRDEAPLRRAPADASQGGSGTPRVSGVAAVVRGVRPQVPLLWGSGRTPCPGTT